MEVKLVTFKLRQKDKELAQIKGGGSGKTFQERADPKALLIKTSHQEPQD